MRINSVANVKSKSSFIDYLLVLALLCFSGNPAFVSVDYTRELYVWFFAIVAALCLIKRRLDVYVKYFSYILFYILIYLLQLAIVDASFSGIVFVLLKTFIGCSVFLLVGHSFARIYVNIMAFICIISLAFFAYNQLYGILPGIPTSDHTFSLYVYTELIDAEGGFNLRNAGMFWEPGAFQGYINIGLFFLFSKPIIKLLDYLLAGLFMITIITTYSTAGYIIMALIVGYYVIQNRKINIYLKWLLGIVLVIAFIHLYSSLDILGEKVTGSISASGKEESRLTDHIRFASLIFKHPIIGNSYLDDVFSGNGFVLHLVFVGFAGVLYYWGKLYSSLKKQLTSKMTIVFLLLVFLALTGEVFISYPLFLALPFLLF